MIVKAKRTEEWYARLCTLANEDGTIRGPNGHGLVAFLMQQWNAGQPQVSAVLKRLKDRGLVCEEGFIWGTNSIGKGRMITGLKLSNRNGDLRAVSHPIVSSSTKSTDHIEGSTQTQSQANAVPTESHTHPEKSEPAIIQVATPTPAPIAIESIAASPSVISPSGQIQEVLARTKSGTRKRVVLLVDALNAMLATENKFPFETLRSYIEKKYGVIVFADAFIPVNLERARINILSTAGFSPIICPLFEVRESGTTKTKDKVDWKMLDRARGYLDLIATDVVVLVSEDGDIIRNDELCLFAESVGTELVMLRPTHLMREFSQNGNGKTNGHAQASIMREGYIPVAGPGILRTAISPRGDYLSTREERVLQFVADGMSGIGKEGREEVAFTRAVLCVIKKTAQVSCSRDHIEREVGRELRESLRNGKAGGLSISRIVDSAINRNFLAQVTQVPETFRINSENRVMRNIQV